MGNPPDFKPTIDVTTGAKISAADVKNLPNVLPASPIWCQSDDTATPAVHGQNTDKGYGVEGVSEHGTGLFGKGLQGSGVHGVSHSAGDHTAAVVGENTGHGVAILGISVGNDAVVGKCASGKHAGVSAINTSGEGFGLYAKGEPAGHFVGKVHVKGKMVVESGIESHDKFHCLQGMEVAGPVVIKDWAGSSGSLSCTGKLSTERGLSAKSISAETVSAGDVVLTGADCAEQFDVCDGEQLEPGTVVVIESEGALRESCEAYDKKVAGVISGGGEYRPGIILDQRASGKARAAVALVGKVYCKVDAHYGRIEVGDLLTTSATPGHAMKASDGAKAFGAVMGKALRPLDHGRGLIPVLITLQ